MSKTCSFVPQRKDENVPSPCTLISSPSCCQNPYSAELFTTRPSASAPIFWRELPIGCAVGLGQPLSGLPPSVPTARPYNPPTLESAGNCLDLTILIRKRPHPLATGILETGREVWGTRRWRSAARTSTPGAGGAGPACEEIAVAHAAGVVGGSE
jgi:hypothetical protein